MAVRSMTGFGRGEAALQGVRVIAELSSVNRRQLDVNIALPRQLVSLDPRVAEEVKTFVSRGRVTGELVIVYADRIRKEGIRVDEVLAATYLEALRRTAGKLGLADDLKASLLLELPDVVRYDIASPDAERTWPALRRALRQALRGLVEMRTREGRALREDLERQIARLEGELAVISRHAPAVAAQYRQALLDRLAAQDLPLAGGDERLLREVALFADRCDIREEIIRLASHFDQARAIMAGRDPAGKPLDFLAQEMLREINTIGAKASHSRIAQCVVAAKTELERFREQVQNIE